MKLTDVFTDLSNISLVTLAVATVFFSFLFSILRLHRRFGHKTRYALKLTYARWALVGYAVFSTIFALFLASATPKGLVDFCQTIPGAILVAFSASATVAGASNFIGIKSKDQKQLITVATWVYETIDAEIERQITQEIADKALNMMKRHTDTFTWLCLVGCCWVSVNPKFDRHKHKLISQVNIFREAGDETLPELVAFLLNDCECDAQWLESKTGK